MEIVINVYSDAQENATSSVTKVLKIMKEKRELGLES